MHDDTLTQTAPYPEALAMMVRHVQYKDGWRFKLHHLDRGQGSAGLTLEIVVCTPDSYHPEQNTVVHHYMIIPAASYNARSWKRWLFDQILLVEQHEAAEFFRIGGVRPYAPLHGPGNDPYLVAELASDQDRRTSFRGELNPEAP